ncbi:MAG: B12-binding domain-containing radical SAM protein [Chlorobium phaeobacteroides]|jgi:hypothetical protein|nr:B12-binding domain-containing radical SAM protein [Chlorobium phaeobacteroides]
MITAKKVLLVFLPTDSGVDGARSLYTEKEKHPLSQWIGSSMRNLIKKSPFSIPPLSLMILGSIEIPGVEQFFCDMRFEEFPAEIPWDLVGISVQTGMARQAFELADRLRQKGITVALGGAHITLFADSSRPHADILVHGEADDLWRQVLLDLKTGTMHADYRSDNFPDMGIPRPVSKTMLLKNRYFTTNLIQTGRGCPYQCDFCNVHVLNGHTLRRRNIADIVAEVKRFKLHDKRIFFFVDDSINADPVYARELFRQLIPCGINWFGQATTTLGQQPELLETFARSGCQALLVGIESIEPKSREAHRKTQNRATELSSAIRNIRNAGISLYGSFIYGLDGDTLDTPSAILDFISETKLDVPGINILRPIPGTRVFERLKEEGRLLFDPLDITAYRYTFGQEMLYLPKNIPLDAFVESYATLTSKVFTLGASFKRGVAAPSAKTGVLLFNLFYTYLYGLSRHDLSRQIEKDQKKTILPYRE